MNLILSNQSVEPHYLQIKNQIKGAILREELAEGEILPSIRSFANEIKVSVLTIRRVYNELEEEGFVSSKPGVGTFVATGNFEFIRETKLRMVEEKIKEVIEEGRSLGVTYEDFQEMVKIYFEEE